MATTPTFFSPTDAIDINTLLGLGETDPKWVIQTAGPSTQKDRASGLGADGDEVAKEEYNKRKSVSLTYKCFSATGNLSLPSVGTISGGYHIDSVALAYSPTDWPTLTVTAHKHDDGATHAADSCRTYTTDLVFPAQFGVPSSISDGTATVMFAMSVAGIGMRSLSFSLACTHVDEQGSAGNWLAGENHDGVETLDAEFTGVPASGDLTIHADWTMTSDGETSGNTAVDSRTVSLTRHIAKDD